ncbi:MAG TPA: ROK family protein, partial [Naasia sp.]
GFSEAGAGPALLESIASGPSAVAWARERGFAGGSGEELAAASAAGDDIARAAIERSARAVGQAVASATALVDVEVVVIGGGFSHAAPDYLDLVRAARDRARHPALSRAEVVAAALGDEAPLIGAAALVAR